MSSLLLFMTIIWNTPNGIEIKLFNDRKAACSMPLDNIYEILVMLGFSGIRETSCKDEGVPS